MRTVTRNHDSKFDLQLSQGAVSESGLGDLFVGQKIELIEVKSESYKWRRTGNICIEFRSYGKLSGIAKTKAQIWAHALWNDDRTQLYGYLLFEVDRLKELCREAYRRGDWRDNSGDNGATSVVLLKLSDLIPLVDARR